MYYSSFSVQMQIDDFFLTALLSKRAPAESPPFSLNDIATYCAELWDILLLVLCDRRVSYFLKEETGQSFTESI